MSVERNRVSRNVKRSVSGRNLVFALLSVRRKFTKGDTMKRAMLIASTLACMGASSVFGQTRNATMTEPRILYKYLSATNAEMGDPVVLSGNQQAVGYVQGVSDMLVAYSEFCPANGLSMSYVDDVVLDYLDKHRGRWSADASPTLIFMALHKVSPCPKLSARSRK